MRESNVCCKLCGLRLEVPERGRMPEAHADCRDLELDWKRVARRLSGVQGTAKRKAIRTWFMHKFFELFNKTFVVEIKRSRNLPTAEQRLEKHVKALQRTRSGRAALEAWVAAEAQRLGFIRE